MVFEKQFISAHRTLLENALGKNTHSSIKSRKCSLLDGSCGSPMTQHIKHTHNGNFTVETYWNIHI